LDPSRNDEDCPESLPKGPGWVSTDEAVLVPSRFAAPLQAFWAVICYSEDCFNALTEAVGLEDDAPRLTGSRYGKAGKDVAVYWASFGAPAAGMLTEALIASGVKRIIMLGMAGSISPASRIGDVVLPTWGIREEGTSCHYFPSGVDVGVSHHLLDKLKQWMTDQGVAYREGGVWTTDTPFRETRDKVERYAERGVLAVEMECTALMAISTYRGIDFAAALMITDELFHDEWQEGFSRQKLRETRAAVCRALAKGFRHLQRH